MPLTSAKDDKQLQSPVEPEGDTSDKPPEKVCLHCGTDTFFDVNIRLGGHQYPVFLPLQKPPKQT